MMLNRICRKAAIILVLASAGCGFTPDIISVQPNSPVLVIEARGRYVKIAAYRKETNSMVVVGWVPTKEYVRWTFTPFDWEAKIDREGRANARTHRSTSP